MRSRIALLGLGAAVALLIALAGADAEQNNACAGFYDVTKGDRRAADVYVGVARPHHEAACFLVPRSTLKAEFRDSYRDGVTAPFELDPTKLSDYLENAKQLPLASGRHIGDSDSIACLKEPMPDSIAILGERSVSLDMEAARSRMKEAITDVPGYRRYVDEYGDDNYFATDAKSKIGSFWCSNGAEPKICGIVGEYDGMQAGIRYFKKDMPGVNPDLALQCVRSIAALFRLK
jgi:hypothetical protein